MLHIQFKIFSYLKKLQRTLFLLLPRISQIRSGSTSTFCKCFFYKRFIESLRVQGVGWVQTGQWQFLQCCFFLPLLPLTPIIPLLIYYTYYVVLKIIPKINLSLIRSTVAVDRFFSGRINVFLVEHRNSTQVQALMFVTPPWVLPSKSRLQRIATGHFSATPAKGVWQTLGPAPA
jgi:hypothetical protein